MSPPNTATAAQSRSPLQRPALLGIAIPAYKRESLLARLLDSINTELPIVVSDNGGYLSDTFKARYPAVKFLSGPEVTVLKNWNRAASSLDSEWIVMPGDDNLYYPSSFPTIERTLQAHPSADIVFFGHYIIDEHDQVRETWQPETRLLRAPHGFDAIRLGAPARPPSIVFRKRLFDQLGGYLQSKVGRSTPAVDRMGALGWRMGTTLEEGFSRTVAAMR